MLTPKECSVARTAYFECSRTDPSNSWSIICSVRFCAGHRLHKECSFQQLDVVLILLLNSWRYRMLSFSHLKFLIYFVNFLWKNPGVPSFFITSMCFYLNIIFSFPATSAKEELLPYFPHIMEYLRVCEIIVLSLGDWQFYAKV